MITIKYNHKDEQKIHLPNEKAMEEEDIFRHTVLVEQDPYWQLKLYEDEIHWFNLDQVQGVMFNTGCDNKNCDICIWENEEEEE